MVEKKCRYCAMMIPKEAKICPHCRKRQGWTLPAKIVLGFIFFIVLIQLMDSLDLLPSKTTSYTPQQKKAAESFHKTVMDTGLVIEFKPEGKLQIVYVDRKMWNVGSYEKKKQILKGLSESNEILGYTPWIEIRDYRSGEVYGALKPPLTLKIYK